MYKLADISVLENLQRAQNERMGYGHLAVFNDMAVFNDVPIGNVTLKMGGKTVDLNDQNTIPIIRGAFERDGTNKALAELEQIEREMPMRLDEIEQSSQFSEQEKSTIKEKAFRENAFKFLKKRREIQQNTQTTM